MHEKLVREGNSVYEIDEECVRRKEKLKSRQDEHGKQPKRGEVRK